LGGGAKVGSIRGYWTYVLETADQAPTIASPNVPRYM